MLCAGSGMTNVKETKRFYELLKTCKTKPKKGGTSSATAETKPAAAAKQEAGEAPQGKYRCRGVDKDGNVLIETASDKSSVDCLGDLKAKVATKLCDGSAPEVDFTYQTFTLKKWTKGISVKGRCKK
jgi:hypothetical protein